MEISQQLAMVQEVMNRKLFAIYQKEFVFKMIAVLNTDKRWFNEQLSKIDLLSALIETSIMLGYPRRAFQYLCALDNGIKYLTKHVDKAYTKTLEQNLLV